MAPAEQVSQEWQSFGRSQEWGCVHKHMHGSLKHWRLSKLVGETFLKSVKMELWEYLKPLPADICTHDINKKQTAPSPFQFTLLLSYQQISCSTKPVNVTDMLKVKKYKDQGIKIKIVSDCLQKKRSNIIAHCGSRPFVRFGKADACNVWTECSLPAQDSRDGYRPCVKTEWWNTNMT